MAGRAAVLVVALAAFCVVGSVFGGQALDCRFSGGPVTAANTISVTNVCGASAKVRTCAAKFQHCQSPQPGYPNGFQDCKQRIANGSTVALELDDTRGYIVIDCPNWFGPTIDNWWTVTKKDGKWPTTYTIPRPQHQ